MPNGGKMFSILSKAITIGVRDAGKDPEFNPRVRTVIRKSKAANMPADNVKKAIQKGTGEIPVVSIEELICESYGPGGIGMIVEVTTDNKNRASSEVQSIFGKCGDNLVGAGALAFSFQGKGQFIIDRIKIAEEKSMDIVLDAGAEQVKVDDECYEHLTAVVDYDAVAHPLQMPAADEAPLVVPVPNVRKWAEHSLIALAKTKKPQNDAPFQMNQRVSTSITLLNGVINQKLLLIEVQCPC
jgi:YebC/PmpR family DNA-binding regulatory protein